MVPMISSICRGVIGVCQLPRTWWKAVTRAVDILDPDYPDNSGGLDASCLQAMNLDVDETYDYLRSELPDYISFERWIIDKKGPSLPAAQVQRFNEIIRHRRHIRPHKITETYEDIGFDPEVDTYTSALLLNSLQDWHLFHAKDFVTDQISPGVIPLVSSIEVGPLDVMQLPRTWYKILLDSKGLLKSDYPPCGGGLDQRVLDALGLDREAVISFLAGKQPTYMAFENWVKEEIGEIDREKVNSFQNQLVDREHADPKRSDIHRLTGCDESIRSGVLLNHLEDWRLAFETWIVPRK
jgi:hypothetical protein